MKKASSTTNLIACVAIVGAVAVGFATGPAFAQTSEAPFKFAFTYNAAELQTAPSAEKLLIRLEHEVRDFCDSNARLTLEEGGRIRECVNATMQHTISKFGSSTVAQAYDTRTGG